MRILIFLLFTCLLFEQALSRGGGRGGGARGGSRGGFRGAASRITSRFSSARTVSSRYTSSTGFRSTNRFNYNRGTNTYRYGSYTGSRYGQSIRRTSYWPVGFIFWGRPYRRYNNRPNYSSNNDTEVSEGIVISDTYTKSATFTNDSFNLYNCLSSDGSEAETCYESIDTTTAAVVSDEDQNFKIQDGGCCENTSDGSAVCCIIELNKSIALK